MAITAKAERAQGPARGASCLAANLARLPWLVRVVCAAGACFAAAAASSHADQSGQVSRSMHASPTGQHPPFEQRIAERDAYASYGTVSLWRDLDYRPQRTMDHKIVPAEFAQTEPDEPLPQPRTFDPDDAARKQPSFLEGNDPPRRRPSFLDSDDSALSVTQEIERLNQRINELETARRAHEDATRSIIRQSFAEKGSNINDYVVFGGTLETLTFWFEDFDDVAESDIVLDTAELDFEVTVNNWSVGSLVVEYFDGSDFFPHVGRR
jgi:hypothetical protein